MLSDNLTAGKSDIALHDARITRFELLATDLNVDFNTDYYGGFRKAWFHYKKVSLLQLPIEDVLGKKVNAHADSDVMCHELEKTDNHEWIHTLLFANGQELVIQFKDFAMSFEDMINTGYRR